MNLFEDRADAGRALARHLRSYRRRPNLLVLGLPRGGVPVAWEVAQALKAPLDVLNVRKLGLPSHPELAMGAIASGGAQWINHEVLQQAGVSARQLAQVREAEDAELSRRERLYRGGRPPLDVRGRSVIVVDDGLATGATLHAALLALRSRAPAELVAAVPVSTPEGPVNLAGACDDFVCVAAPQDFGSVGEFYRDFRQVSDAQVQAILARAAAPA